MLRAIRSTLWMARMRRPPQRRGSPSKVHKAQGWPPSSGRPCTGIDMVPDGMQGQVAWGMGHGAWGVGDHPLLHPTGYGRVQMPGIQTCGLGNKAVGGQVPRHWC